MQRKMMNLLLEWKSEKERLPLVIRGLRQVGKTYIVKQFAKENYENAFFLDFRKKPELASLFQGNFSVDDLVLGISALPDEDRLIKGSKMVPGKTILIFDEIQDCPNARASLRYFKDDHRFDVVCTGSMLGVSGYRITKEPSRGIPVGSEEVIDMTAMDFEEFLMAIGMEKDVLDLVKECFDQEKEIPAYIHQRMLELFRRYIVVGGMPEAVEKFVLTNDIGEVRKVQKRIVNDYRADFGTHLRDDGTITINEMEKSRLLQVFQSIPRQLAKENGKFQYSSVGHGARNRTHSSALSWLEGYGLVTLCHNLSSLEQPLTFYELEDEFKVFVNDTGLFFSMLGDDIPAMFLTDSLSAGKGPIYENLIAETFHKAQRQQYYFSRNSGLEIDFVTTLGGKTTLVEVKAKDGRTKAAKEVLTNPAYPVEDLLKFTSQNIGKSGNIFTVPYYIAFYALSKRRLAYSGKEAE
jgi:predicted AAA+ superfamily ATPase